MSTLDSYEILHQIGEGGMAVVYKAAQPELKRFVIIKKLKKHDPESVERFHREAYVSAALSQENIVATHDAVVESIEVKTGDMVNSDKKLILFKNE